MITKILHWFFLSVDFEEFRKRNYVWLTHCIKRMESFYLFKHSNSLWQNFTTKIFKKLNSWGNKIYGMLDMVFPKQVSGSKHRIKINGSFSWYFYILQTTTIHPRQNSWFYSTQVTTSTSNQITLLLSERCHHQRSCSDQTEASDSFWLPQDTESINNLQ